MPTYPYRASGERSCEHCRDGFDVEQRMADAPLELCPQCGAEVKRVITSFSVWKGETLSTSNIKSHGFTRLRKVDKGVYEKD